MNSPHLPGIPKPKPFIVTVPASLSGPLKGAVFKAASIARMPVAWWVYRTLNRQAHEEIKRHYAEKAPR